MTEMKRPGLGLDHRGRGNVKHRPSVTDLVTNQTRLLRAPWRGHSMKPVEFHDLVESLCPASRYADLFSRYQHNDKWDCHGDEAPSADSDVMPDIPAFLRRDGGMSRRRCPEKNPLLQLLEPDVSLERAWAEISIAHVRDRAAVSTVEALMFALRSSVHALGRPDTLRRLADFALWATACETAFWDGGTFAKAYGKNRDDAVSTVIEADLVATAVQSFMATRTQ